MKKADIEYLNHLGKEKSPFVSLVSFDMEEVITHPMENIMDAGLYFDSPLLTYKPKDDLDGFIILNNVTNAKETYSENLQQAIRYIRDGHSYLLNFTDRSLVETPHTLEEIFSTCRAPYRLYLRDRFVCFSPEQFVKIEDNKIHSYPMKGTIDASLDQAEYQLLNDIKEITEHNTIVDLIRNDLSIIASDVKVERYRYISEIKTPARNILQASSHISGVLGSEWNAHIGDIMDKILPAGSISGAPKKRTLEIIKELESYDRGFYTGVAIFFDGQSLDSAVLIRYMENTSVPGSYCYKSGGGITALSEVSKEYDELLKKIYVPIF